MKTTGKRSATNALAGLLLGMALSACNPATPEGSEVAATPAPATPAAPVTPVAPATLTELDPERLAERADPSDFCSLDTIDGALFTQDPVNMVANPAAVRLTGWVGDRTTLSRPPSPVLGVTTVDGARSWEIALGGPTQRGDVARHFEAATMQESGFDFSADLSALPPGEYALTLGHVTSGRRVSCDKGRRIVVNG